MNKLRKLRNLSWADRRVLVRAAVSLVYAKLALPSTEFRTDTRTTEGDRPAAPSAGELMRARTVAQLVWSASAHSPFRVTCLHRSLSLWWLLRQDGVPCDLKLGTRRGDGPFEAHAWVECGGVALNERAADVSRYTPFAESVQPVGRWLRWRPDSPRMS